MGLEVGAALRHAAAVTPRGLAASLDDDELTFAELDATANRVARAFADLGVGHRDRVAWWGDTSLPALAVFGALAKLGAVFMPVNARFSAPEAEPVLERARPKLLVVDAAHESVAAGFDLPTVPHRALFARAADRPDGDVRERALRETDAHVVFFTSGSTGQPKGVVLSHRVDVLRAFPSLGAGAHPDGGTVCMFPLFHMAGWAMALGAWQSRRPVHLVAAADAAALLHVAERRRAARLYCIPAVWRRVLELGLDGYDLSALREADTGTSATPPALLHDLRAALPHTMTRVFYGSTEAGPATVLGPDDLARKPGSVGLPQAGVTLRVDDGEVCVRSELLMDGYLDDARATADALRDGWYHTGDLGVLDDEGYLSIVGRTGEVIRTGGETVAPAEIEAVLAGHPGISEVAVVGLPDPGWGEVVCAVVVPVDGATLDLDTVRAHCAGLLAGFKQPRRLALLDALPRTAATGQVQRTLLVEQLSSLP